MKKILNDIIAKAPSTPGVYKYLSQEGDLLYVGKAKNLKKRLQSYIRPSAKLGVKNQKMIEAAHSVEWVETNSEVEALILEDNLIKENTPKYNVLLKDSKTFQYIKVTLQKDYPELLTVRKIIKDGAKYFGPKTNGSDVIRIIESAKKIFKLCSQKNISLAKEGTPLKGAKVAVKVGGQLAKRPCLDYHIRRCSGPCAGVVTPEEYGEQIQSVLRFLEGDLNIAISYLKEQMMSFAKNKKFERAASIRDQITAIERSVKKQQIITDTLMSDRDVVAYVEDLGKYYFTLFQVRGGRLIAQEKFISEEGETPEEIMEAFLKKYYSIAADIPKEIIISIALKNKKSLEEFLGQLNDRKIKIHHPKLGHKDRLISLAEKNARSYAEQSRVRWMLDDRKGEKALKELKEGIGLNEMPNRIECYDISHLGGTETIGSMVVFKKGEPAVKEYRQFRLRSTANKNDDFKSMEEVLTRRLNYLPEKLPNDYSINKLKKKEASYLEGIKGLKNESYKDFFVLYYKKEIVGHGQLVKHNEKIDELKNLWIQKKHQGKKLGHFIIKKLINNSKKKRVYISCDKEYVEYYLKMSFEEIKKAPNEIQSKESKKEMAYLAYQKKKIDSSFSAHPDLIVIDGGKGQLHAAHDVLFNKGIKIPMISLAKREEEVFVPGKSNPLNIPKNSEANYILQRIRDEAHRFAITANRNSRDKKMVKSVLDEIPGVGPKLKKKLLTHFGSAQRIKEAGDVELQQLVGEKIAEAIRAKL